MAASLFSAMKAAERRVEETLANVARNKWTDVERSQYCEDMPEHPMFNTAFNGTDNNEIVQAMKRTEYDDLDTPENLASECKDKGNAAFARGVDFHGMAIKHYLDGIQHARMVIGSRTTAIKRLESTCQSNLAAVYLIRKKYITVLDACCEALRLWPDNAKAAFRASKAALELGKAASALEFCELGLTIDPANSAFNPVLVAARTMLSTQESNAAAAQEATAARSHQLAAVRAACTERGIRVGPPLYNGMKRTSADPYVDTSDVLHFPVLVLYPAIGTSDYVEDWAEVDSVGELVAMMLPDDGPPQAWDPRGEYRASNCDIFYKSNPCKPLASIDQAWTQAALEAPPEESWKDVRWVRVPAAAPLLLPLVQESYVTADLPVFYVVAQGSSFYTAMKAGAAGGQFVALKVPDLPPRE